MERLPEVINAEHVDVDAPMISLLRQQLDELREEMVAIRKDFVSLATLVKSARVVFGSIPSSPVAPQSSQETDKWEKIKAKLGGKLAEVIEALQVHGASTRTQLRVITGSGMSTIDQCTAKLRDMGLLVKSGDGWSLKP